MNHTKSPNISKGISLLNGVWKLDTNENDCIKCDCGENKLISVYLGIRLFPLHQPKVTIFQIYYNEDCLYLCLFAIGYNPINLINDYQL